jgi:hypothetical protein
MFVLPIPRFVIDVVTPETVVLDCREPPDAVIVAIPALNVTSSPVPKLTVTADPTFTLSSSTTIPVPAAVTLSSAEPSIAGNVPVSCPAGRVRFAPDPENEVAVMKYKSYHPYP